MVYSWLLVWCLRFYSRFVSCVFGVWLLWLFSICGCFENLILMLGLLILPLCLVDCIYVCFVSVVVNNLLFMFCLVCLVLLIILLLCFCYEFLFVI